MTLIIKNTGNSLYLGETDLPASFQAADHGSVQAKRIFLLFSRIDLALIIFGAFTTSWAIESDQGRGFLAILGAFSLGAGLLTSLYIKISDAEKTWFSYRAVAESLKTISWRYMTRSTPYEGSITLAEVDKFFTEHLGGILQMPRSKQATLAGEEAIQDQITSKMREVRSLDLKGRKLIYVDQRIREQRAWYTKRSKQNSDDSSKMLFWLILCQGIAVSAAIILVRWPNFNFNFASIFSAASAAIIAWLQLKRFQELAFSYAQAAHELGLIIAREQHVISEEDFSQFVSDAENAISREHTMWLARRDYV